MDGRRRLALVILWAIALLAVVVALPLGTAHLPDGRAGRIPSALRTATGPSLVLVAALLCAWIALTALRALRQRELPPAPEEEPLLPAPWLPSTRSDSPAVVVAGVVPGCGATTIAFNLAVLLATLGEIGVGPERRRPRPVCLLAGGPLASALGLRADTLDDYLARHPYATGPDLPNLALRHPSGCELLCLDPDSREADSWDRVVRDLRRLYDVVLLDLPQGLDQDLRDRMVEIGEVVLLVASSQTPAEQVAPWADRVWERRQEKQTALLVNRVRAGRGQLGRIDLGFLYLAEIPDDPGVAEFEARVLPWALSWRSPAARQLETMARQLFPRLLRDVEGDAVA